MNRDAEEGEIIPGAIKAGEYRASIATRDLKQWLKKVGLPYHSPHKFRHGNAVYSIKMAKDIAALKAVSQNLMHSNLSITDGVYGILSELDGKNQISNLAKEINIGSESKSEMVIQKLEQLLNDIREKKD